MKVCTIGGCGHVGLPLSLLLADRGHEVTIYDINKEVVARVKGGEMPFLEEGGPQLLKKVLASGNLSFSLDGSCLAENEILILIIGTPVDEHLTPAVHLIQRFLNEHLPHFRAGQTLVLRSTVFPGTTQKVHKFFHERRLDVHVAFCPERVAQGRSLLELAQLPQLVAGCDRPALLKARGLFECLGSELIEVEPMEAELAKIFNNVWRYIQFATANQFYMIADEHGLDFAKIRHAATYKYPRAQGMLSQGFAAGPCLFKDTMQLASFNRNNFFLGHAAMLINEGLPDYIIRKMKGKCRELGKNLHETAAGILGMAFKANCDDPRDSLSYKLKHLLEIEAYKVSCTDVYIQSPHFLTPEEVILNSDIVIIATPHREYRDLDYSGVEVLDVWDFLKGGSGHEIAGDRSGGVHRRVSYRRVAKSRSRSDRVGQLLEVRSG